MRRAKSLRILPGASLRPPLPFNPRPRRLSTPTDAFQLHPDVALYGTTLRHATDDPRVIDVMLFKANQEMVTVAAHHFQRHHLITKYVAPESNVIDKARARGEKPKSAFLSAFLGGKATEPNGGIPKDF